MALSSIGEPVALNAAFLNGQALGVRAKLSGITSRSAQEQALKVEPKSSQACAKVASCEWSLQLGGLASTLPPCAGTTTSEQRCFWSQPRNWFSVTVLIKISAWPVPSGEVIAYTEFIGPNGPDCPVTPPLLVPLQSAIITGYTVPCEAYGALTLGVKLAQVTCNIWFTRLLVWSTVTLLALASGLPWAGSHSCGPVTVAPEFFVAAGAPTLATARPGWVRPGSISSPPVSDTRPARASTRRGRKARTDGLRMRAPEMLKYERPWPAPHQVHTRAPCRASLRRCRLFSSPGVPPPSLRASANSSRTTIISAIPAPKARATMVLLTASMCAYSQMNSGRLTWGPCSGLKFISLVTPDTTSTGAVSPMPRAIASTTAVASPARAVGRTTFSTVRHWLDPRA